MSTKKSHLQESLGFMIHLASRMIRSCLNQELTKTGYHVTGEQCDVLFQLWCTDGQHQQKLAEILYKDKTTMTRLLNSIEKLNLIKRVSNKRDKRQKLVYLTTSGEKTIKELTRCVQRVLKKAQKGIKTKDMVVCKGVLRGIHKRLSEKPD